MVIGFEQLGGFDFAVSNISVICQQPPWRRLNIRKRICNGFVYVTHGQCRFTFNGGSFTVSEGGLAYLPLTSRHLLEVLSPEIRFYQVNFTMSIQGEITLFSNEPLKLTDSISPECANAICQLEQICSRDNDTVQKNAKLCAVFSELQKNVARPYARQLSPALQYLQQNLTQPLDCKHLADLCYLSTTRFYQLFRREFGVTPLQYRDQLLINRATMLLKLGDLRVNEIAQMLGFDDPAYFSRFFRKKTGRCPSKFMTGRDME